MEKHIYREAVLTASDMLKLSGAKSLIRWLAENKFDTDELITTFTDTDGNRVFVQIEKEKESTDERTESEAPAKID